MAEKKGKKKIKVHDLKPKKDAKAGRMPPPMPTGHGPRPHGPHGH
jgi:hypothetical protein